MIMRYYLLAQQFYFYRPLFSSKICLLSKYIYSLCLWNCCSLYTFIRKNASKSVIIKVLSVPKGKSKNCSQRNSCSRKGVKMVSVQAGPEALCMFSVHTRLWFSVLTAQRKSLFQLYSVHQMHIRIPRSSVDPTAAGANLKQLHYFNPDPFFQSFCIDQLVKSGNISKLKQLLRFL